MRRIRAPWNAFLGVSLAALTLSIALTNLWNRLNITTRQVAGEWVKSAAVKETMETVEK